MPYKVFLVEDEIVTREGIRDNVNWQGAGFAFCGEAPDGELALPLIQTLQPDLLITDIKMPFMDGLSLSRLVREQMPRVRIVILSGHDEFHYAREAITIGVSDYLLKPLGVREMEALLRRIGQQIDEERAQQQRQQLLEAQVEQDLALRRDRHLLQLLTVGASATAALEEARALGLALQAAAYQVVLVRSEFVAQTHDYSEQEAFHVRMQTLAQEYGAWLTLRKDVDESVFVALAESAVQAEAMCAELVRDLPGVERPVGLRIHSGIGTVQSRVQMLNQSYSAAQYELHASIRSELREELGGRNEVATGEEASADMREPIGARLINLNRAALQEFMRTGIEADFEAMFARYMGSLDCATLRQPLVEQYVRTDMALTIAKFVLAMGGNPDHLFAELGTIGGGDLGGEADSNDGKPEAAAVALKMQLREACLWALDLRDHRATNRNAAVVQKAQRYVEAHFDDASLSLAEVAREVGLSPNHFSAIYSAETGETFRDALVRLRIEAARTLLRTTPMSNGEVCDQVGYSDPHYFGAVFKRVTGQTPQQYRSTGVEAR